MVWSALAWQDVKFADLDAKAENQVVLVYKSGEEASDNALASLSLAYEKLKGMGLDGLENIAFKKSDAADVSNANKMSEKGIATYPMIFVAVAGQGLGQYPVSFFCPKGVSQETSSQETRVF